MNAPDSNSLRLDTVEEFLAKQAKAGGILFKISAVVMALLFLLIFLGSLLDKDPLSEKFGALVFAAVICLLPAALLFRAGKKRNDPLNNKSYAAYVLHPDKIVWVYVKKVIRIGLFHYDLYLNDDSGKSTIVHSLEMNYEARLDEIVKRCPNAVVGYQDNWEKLYRKSPRDFIERVKAG